MMDAERAHELVERGVVEIAPLAYMRGRTLNDAFVILDEAQNTTPEQMKMFLTRLGFNSTFVITGDATQRDLPGKRGGLTDAQEILCSVEGIAFVELARAMWCVTGLLVRLWKRTRRLMPKACNLERRGVMAVLISNDAELPTLIAEEEIRAIAAHVLAAEGVEREVEISLSFVDESEMRELNHEWRGIDRTTDVLSFECDSALTMSFLPMNSSSLAMSSWRPR